MVKIETVFNKELTKALQNYSIKKSMIFLSILSLLIIFLGVILIFLEEYEFGIGIIIFAVLYVPFLFLVMKLSQKSLDKSYQLVSDETISTYEFNNDYIKITVKKGDDFFSEITTKYFSIYKAIETSDTYFLYISKTQSYVFFKKDIVEGSVEELNALLKNNLGKKFNPFKKHA